MGARLLLCDEPTEASSPVLVHQIGDILRDVKAAGVTVLLVEQNVRFASTVADRHYLLAQGRVAQTLDNTEVQNASTSCSSTSASDGHSTPARGCPMPACSVALSLPDSVKRSLEPLARAWATCAGWSRSSST